MHPEIVKETSGRCPKCGINLIHQEEAIKERLHNNETTLPTGIDAYKPLLIIIGFILLVAITISIKDVVNSTFSISKSLSIFMAGFFLVFSGFKLLDLKGFAQGYYTYDLLAKRVFVYGYIYPFLELALGIGYILFAGALLLNLFAFILMVFSGVGVLTKLAKHERFQCSCLGTIFKLPLTQVTLIEDFGMAMLGLIMLFLR